MKRYSIHGCAASQGIELKNQPYTVYEDPQGQWVKWEEHGDIIDNVCKHYEGQIRGISKKAGLKTFREDADAYWKGLDNLVDRDRHLTYCCDCIHKSGSDLYPPRCGETLMKRDFVTGDILPARCRDINRDGHCQYFKRKAEQPVGSQQQTVTIKMETETATTNISLEGKEPYKNG